MLYLSMFKINVGFQKLIAFPKIIVSVSARKIYVFITHKDMVTAQRAQEAPKLSLSPKLRLILKIVRLVSDCTNLKWFYYL